MGLSVETLAVAKKYTDSSISGISGTLAGKNCTIQSITDIEGGHRVTFQWTADDSTVRTSTMDVMDGSGAEAIEQIYADNGVLGAKNILPPTIYKLTTAGSGTGTKSLTTNDNAVSFVAELKSNTDYIISAVSGDRYRVGLTNTFPANGTSADFIYDNASVRTYTFNSGNYKYLYVLTDISGSSYDTIKPMLRLASDPDDTYQPYAMTNKELTNYANTYMSGKGTWYAGNCDDLPNGVIAIGSSATNAPFSWGLIQTMYEKGVIADTGVQLGLSATSDILAVRHKNEGTWSAWKKATLSSI